MSDIPEDIRKAARRILFGARDPGGPIHSEEIAICRAIMAERERCATKAMNCQTFEQTEYGAGADRACVEIAEAIRSGK